MDDEKRVWRNISINYYHLSPYPELPWEGKELIPTYTEKEYYKKLNDITVICGKAAVNTQILNPTDTGNTTIVFLDRGRFRQC